MTENGDRAGHPAENTAEVRVKPAPTEYGSLVDKMVATVATWPTEYQRSVDVHQIDVPQNQH